VKARTVYRLINLAIWIAVWMAIAIWTETTNDWFAMAMQAVLPGVPALFIHLALREPEAPPTAPR
jgi:hypothetical protein